MWSSFSMMASNLGVSFEWVVLFVILFGGGIFCAKNFQLGMIMYFIAFGGAFMVFYQWGLNYVPALILFFMSLVVMSLSLYASSQVVKSGGLV